MWSTKTTFSRSHHTKYRFVGTHLNPETMLYPEKLRFQIFGRRVSRYFVLLWPHGLVPHQNVEVTYQEINDMLCTKMTFSLSRYTK